MAAPAQNNVISALASVMTEIGGIVKKKGGEGGITYPYRGIDAIASAAQPLLGAAGVVIVPTSAVITSIEELTVNGKPWTDTFVTVDWTIYGPGGVADCVEARTCGIGRDNTDKGYNKAATQAFKNLMLRLFCIGDPQDDADQPGQQNNFTDQRGRVQAASPGQLMIDRVKSAGLSDDQIAEIKQLGTITANALDADVLLLHTVGAFLDSLPAVLPFGGAS